MATATELGTTLSQKRQEHGVWLATFKKDSGYDMPGDKVDEFHVRNAELVKLQGDYETALQVEKSVAENDAKLAPLGRMVKDSSVEIKGVPEIETKAQMEVGIKSALAPHAERLTALSKGDLTKGFPRIELPVGLKTIVALTDHYAQAFRAQTTGSALYYNSVEDLFQSGTVNTNNVEYFIQTTDTDNADFVAEATAVTDSYFTWTKTTDEIEDAQTWIPISRDLVSDEGFMLSMIQGLLADRLSKKISKELMYGTGSTPHLWGATVRTGFQTQAKGTDPVFDTVLKAITLVAVTGDATPDAIVIHPTDWQNIVLTRTTDGIYLLGNPGNAPANPVLWGLPVRVSSTVAASAGTAAVGAFKTMAQVFYNGGLVVETSTEHSTYFTERKIALALSQRMGVVHYRPSAFVKITGL